MYLINATSNCAQSFQRLVRPSGKLLKMLMPAYIDDDEEEILS